MSGKRYKESVGVIEKDKIYGLSEAVDALLKMKKAKFDETVEASVKLGIDPKKTDQLVRGTVVLPAGTGKAVKIAVFAKGEKVNEALEAGAIESGGDDLVEKVKKGWLDFDIAVSTPDMMRSVGQLGKILGTRGLMPNPKTGTVTFDIKQAVEEIKKGKISFRVDGTGVVHMPVGKLSFTRENLEKNLRTVFNAIVKAKPSSAKGQYIQSAYISSTMSPAIKINLADITKVVEI